MSEDGRRGREWREYNHTYRRNDRCLERRLDSSSDWKDVLFQVAAMENSECTWADEPKTLTPAEALRALADGKCIDRRGWTVRVTADGFTRCWNKSGEGKWYGTECPYSFVGFHVVPDPSQPAEPQVEYPKSSCSCMGDASCPCRRNK